MKVHTWTALHNGEVRSDSRDPLSEGCPEHIIRSVANKNAGLTAVRAAEKRMGMHCAETRSRVVAAKRSARHIVTQAQIDEMVENRDLTKYPLAAWEINDREMVRARRRAMLEQF